MKVAEECTAQVWNVIADMEQKRKSFSLSPLSVRNLDVMRLLPAVVVIVIALLMTVLFYKLCYVGLQTRDAIDVAQIARNISEGHGFTTRFVRPSNSLYFKNPGKFYPELNHGPLYPLVVALVFKARTISEQAVEWTSIAFFLLTLAGVYALGKMLFDRRIGLLATGLFGLSLPTLKSAISGEQWTLCTLLFTLLMIAMAAHHAATDSGSVRKGIGLATVSAALTAALYMTDPVMVFVAVPTAVYFGVTGSARRTHLTVFLAAYVVFVAPWSIRNMTATGIPVLGAAGWDIASRTSAYPADTLYRTVGVANQSFLKLVIFPMEHFGAMADKIASGITELTGGMMTALGCFAMAFAVVGMLYKFRSNTANALRGYIYGALPMMILCFAAFGTDKSSVLMFAPLAAVLASAYFLLLLDAKRLHSFFVKLLIGALLFLTTFPAVITMLQSDKTVTTEAGQELRALLTRQAFITWAEKAPIYTDVPWMVAWCTQSVGVWLPVSDADCQMLSGAPLPFNILLLTPECENYAHDEIWYALHSVRIWREYIQDRDRGVDEIMKAAGVTVHQYPNAPAIIDRIFRRFKAAGSARGFTSVRQDPLLPDRIQLFVRSEAH